MKTLYLLALLLLPLTSFAQTENATYYINKADKEVGERKYEEALNTLSEGILKMPDTVALYDMRGTLLEAFRAFDEAITDFSVGIEKSDNASVKSHLLANRGGTKYRIMDYNGAYDDLVFAVELDSTNIDALNNLAAVCDEVNKPDETLIYLNQIVRIDPNYVPAYVNLGFKYQVLNDHRKAIEYFDKAVELSPEEPLGYSNRAFSKLKLNELSDALEDINYSIKLYPTNAYAFKIRALIYIEKEQLNEACADLKTASELGYTLQYGEEVDELLEKYCKED